MTPTQHVANIIVSFVAAYPQHVTDSMHAGIDLARALQAGDLEILKSPELCTEILHTEKLIEWQVMQFFSGMATGYSSPKLAGSSNCAQS